MSFKNLSRWYPNFNPSTSRSAGDDDHLASLVKGRVLPCMEGGDKSLMRREMPAHSMCLNVVLSSDVGPAGNTVRPPATLLLHPHFTRVTVFALQVRSSLIAAVSAVQEQARSSGVSIVVEDAGAGLRKTVPPGDEVCLVAPPIVRRVMW